MEIMVGSVLVLVLFDIAVQVYSATPAARANPLERGVRGPASLSRAMTREPGLDGPGEPPWKGNDPNVTRAEP